MSATHIAMPSSGATPQAACIMSHFSAVGVAAVDQLVEVEHGGPSWLDVGVPRAAPAPRATARARTRKAARLVKARRFAYLAAMAIRSILMLPDPRLRKAAAPVEAIDADLRALAADMLETMYEAPGIGLAATQLGAMKRMFVMDCAGKDERRAADRADQPRAALGAPRKPSPARRAACRSPTSTRR